jgi:hypothetical protein
MGRRNFLDNFLRFSRGFEITVFIREANNTIGVCDVNPLGIWSKGIEGDSEGLV